MRMKQTVTIKLKEYKEDRILQVFSKLIFINILTIQKHDFNCVD